MKEYGTRLIYPGDEWYLAAERPVPEGDFYEEYAQLENGVGMWRLYRDEFLGALAHSRTGRRIRRMDVVTGTLAAPLIQEMMEALHGRHPSVKVTVHPIRNNFFGGNISVAGLVTGTDIIDQCKGKLTSDVLGVPEVMLRDEQDRFLDDVTVEQLAEASGCAGKDPAGGRGREPAGHSGRLSAGLRTPAAASKRRGGAGAWVGFDVSY